MAPNAVLFDVDGTLVDSNYLHALAWWRALDDADRRTPMSVLHRLIGMGGPQLLTEVMGHPDDAISRGHSRHYQRLKGELTPLPGAQDLLRKTKAAGLSVILATSAKAHDLDDLLRVIEGDDFIDAVVSDADVEQAKPAGDIFATALEKAGCGPDAALAVGDTPWDVEAAGKVGLACVTVLTGGHSRADLLSAGSVAVYHDAADLARHFSDSPLGRLTQS